MIRIATIFALLGLIGIGASGVAQPTEFMPLDVALTREVRTAEISPNGKWIAYTATQPRNPLKDPSGTSYVELFVVDTSTGVSRTFINGKDPIRSVAWTPDGSGLSFLAKRGDDKNTAVYVIPIDGGEAQKLLEHATSISGFEWSSDGKQIAFLATEPDATRVHPSQSMELYRNLKVLNKAPVRLVLYPGEGHGNQKSAARYDYNLRLMQWMEHYLKGAGGEPPKFDLDYGLRDSKPNDAQTT